jgi:hypothetical protein
MNSPPQSPTGKPVTSLFVLGAHVTWFFIGPIVMLAALYGIGQSDQGWATVMDLLYFIAAAWVVLARWVDQQSGQGSTGDGRPSTWADFRRYLCFFVPLTIALWIGANIIGNHL